MSVFNNFQEVQEAYNHLMRKSYRFGACICVGSRSDKYTDFRYTLKTTKRRIRTKAHQVAMLFRLAQHVMPVGTETSHLCNSKNCINVNHLNAEDRQTNMDRTRCIGQRAVRGPQFCWGHGNQPNCL